MSTPSAPGPVVRRIDRFLAFSSLGLLLVSVACFLSVIIATATGTTDFSGGAWPTIFLLQYYGPIIAFVMLLTLLIMNFTRRKRTETAD